MKAVLAPAEKRKQSRTVTQCTTNSTDINFANALRFNDYSKRMVKIYKLIALIKMIRTFDIESHIT